MLTLKVNLFSTINEVDMVIDATVWKEVTDLDMGGVCKFNEMSIGYSKMQAYRECFLTLGET